MSNSIAVPANDSLSSSSTLDLYENLGAIGEGSYGLVLKCRHKPTGQVVALKRFIDTDEDRAVRKIAAREIRFLRSLNHENVVTLLDVFKRNRRLYLVFEYIEYSLLDFMEKSNGGLSFSHTRKYLFQIIRALNYMHDQNVIHRDLKPENILITDGGFLKLCDLGFARSVSTAYSRCYTEYVATRWYRAPELLVGDSRYGKPIDLWALGCLIPEMITSQPLFPGSSDVDQLYQIVRSVGDLCSRHQTIVRRNPAFIGWKWPKQKDKYAVDRRVKQKAPQSLLRIIRETLRMDPSSRFTVKQVMSTEFFKDTEFVADFNNEMRRMVRKHRAKNPHLKRYSTKLEGSGDGSGSSTAQQQQVVVARKKKSSLMEKKSKSEMQDRNANSKTNNVGKNMKPQEYTKLKYFSGPSINSKEYYTRSKNSNILLPGVKIAKAYIPKDPK